MAPVSWSIRPTVPRGSTGSTDSTTPRPAPRFVVSRILYRRLGRYVWWLMVPFLVVLALRLGITALIMGRAGNGLPGKALRHAHSADFGDQVAVAILVVVVGMAVLAVVLWLLSRRVWSALGGGALEAAHHQAAANDVARDGARRLLGHGYAGLVTASTFEPELTHLGVGFYANVGASTRVTGEHRGRFGLPPCSWPANGELDRARDRRRTARAPHARAP